jgi:hypothetical protein
MLVDEDNSNVLPLLRELCECFLDLRLFRLLVYDQKVTPRIGRFGDMTNPSKEQTGDGTSTWSVGLVFERIWIQPTLHRLSLQ